MSDYCDYLLVTLKYVYQDILAYDVNGAMHFIYSHKQLTNLAEDSFYMNSTLF